MLWGNIIPICCVIRQNEELIRKGYDQGGLKGQLISSEKQFSGVGMDDKYTRGVVSMRDSVVVILGEFPSRTAYFAIEAITQRLAIVKSFQVRGVV